MDIFWCRVDLAEKRREEKRREQKRREQQRLPLPPPKPPIQLYFPTAIMRLHQHFTIAVVK
jgi:hypothetical protein